MRRALMIVTLVFACGSAWAQQAGQAGGNPYGEAAGRQKGGQWRMMNYSLPGGYAFLDRLNLSEDQQKVLDEIASEWSAKSRKAGEEAMKKVGTMSREDMQDPEKVKAYQEKYAAAWKEAKVAIPVDQIANLLAPEQLGKVLEADQAVTAWRKWLADHMAKYDKMLDDAVGPSVVDSTPWSAWLQYQVLDAYLKGGAALGSRLGLTKEQMSALEALAKQLNAEYQARMALSYALSGLSAGDQWTETTRTVNAAFAAWNTAETTAKRKEGVVKILTDAQRDKLEKGVKIVEERDKLTGDRLPETMAKLDKILPRQKVDAAAPGAVMPYPNPYYGYRPQ